MPLPVRNARIKLSQGLIFWREVGQGTPIVFLHGSWKDSSQWLPVMQGLSNQSHCFAPDLLGFGESDPVKGHCSIAFQVECLQEYLNSLSLSKIYLVGHSLGAWVAASYALKNLEQVKGLVLLAPEGVVTESWHKNWQQQNWQHRSKKIADWLWRSLSNIVKQLPGNLSLQRWLQKQALPQPPDATAKLLFQRRRAEIQAESLHDRLQFLNLPVLVLCGDRDRPQTLEICRVYARLCPQGKLTIIPETDGTLAESLPDLVVQEIQQFLLD
jgi:pimeloyl-ACP methyl ester carboxylesterase